jgi:glycosyltransferase involved in cell wall biosynthesis
MHVTVLIPVYNRERFIGDALDSVIAQDYHEWDILVVDDGSTDRSVEVVKSRMSDDRIALIQMKHGGCAAATAIGIEYARGPVITSLDSDDKLMPDSLSAVMPSFENNPRLGFAWTNCVDSTGDKGPGDFLPYDKTFFEALIGGWWRVCAQRFFRKEFYLQSEGLDTSIKYAVDVQLALLIGKTGCDTMHIPKVTYWLRLHPHRISNEHHAEQYEAWRLLRRKYCVGSPALTELYIEGLGRYIVEIEKETDALRSWAASIEKERIALRSELTNIKKCFGYKLMRLYGPIIDQALPDGTRRGELKRRVLDLLGGLS